MSEVARKLKNERKRHMKLRKAVRSFLADFQTGTHSDWQESLGVLQMIVSYRRPEPYQHTVQK